MAESRRRSGRLGGDRITAHIVDQPRALVRHPHFVVRPRTTIRWISSDWIGRLEFGMVNLKGKSIPDRAKAMISLAHPDFRDGLEREAGEHGLIPRGLA